MGDVTRRRWSAALVAIAVTAAAACSESESDDADTTEATASVDESAEATEGDDATDGATEPDDGADDGSDEATDGGEGTEDGAGETDDPDDEASSGDTGEAADDASEDGAGAGRPVVTTFAGQEWFLGTVPAEPVAADESLEPVRIGMINQENTPVGSFPEVRAATEAGAAWVNAELGGVDGRPVEIVTCITSFDVEQSQSCAQRLVQDDVVALVGGVDITSNGSFPVIEQNGLAQIGGVPANLVEQLSPNAFFFSGGGAGAVAGFVGHAAEQGASKIAIAYGEFESFEIAARDYGAAVATSVGLEAELIPFSLFATDYLPVITKAQEVGADALVVLAADSACVPVVQTAADLGFEGQLYLTGACATEAILDATGDAITTTIFNSEGPIDPGDPEGDLYQAVVDAYATEPAGGTGTVGFRSFMNLYALLVELGGDQVSSPALLDLVRAAEDRPSFWGHPYTCDGQQVPGLPALCAPQQVLFAFPDPQADPVAVTDWIATDELFAAALG